MAMTSTSAKQEEKFRFYEHDKYMKNNETDKLSVAKHMLKEGHKTDLSKFKLIQKVNKYNELDAYESLHINKNEGHLNENEGPVKIANI